MQIFVPKPAFLSKLSLLERGYKKWWILKLYCLE